MPTGGFLLVKTYALRPWSTGPVRRLVPSDAREIRWALAIENSDHELYMLACAISIFKAKYISFSRKRLIELLGAGLCLWQAAALTQDQHNNIVCGHFEKIRARSSSCVVCLAAGVVLAARAALHDKGHDHMLRIHDSCFRRAALLFKLNCLANDVLLVKPYFA